MDNEEKIRLLLDQMPVGRQAKAEAFLVLTGRSKSRFAKIMDLHISQIGKALSGERPFEYIIHGMEQLGFPKEFLPEPVPGGNKRTARFVASRVDSYLREGDSLGTQAA